MHTTVKETANDENFATALSDVVWRFHVYDQYGKKADKAVKALARRVPGYSTEFYNDMFELHLEILKTTIQAVNDAPKYPKPDQKFSAYSDVDTKYVLNKLRAAFPGHADKFLSEHLGMVIYWYYLR